MVADPSQLLAGEEYAHALASLPARTWFECDEFYRSSGYRTPAAFILVHPAWYGGEGTTAASCPVRGMRRFSMSAPPAGSRCQSQELWGYGCPFPYPHLQPDHRFPFALGGPTVATNAIWLCAAHNAAKSADWHLEKRAPSGIAWFEPMLEAVRGLVVRLGGG